MPTDEQRWNALPRCPYCNEKGTHAPQCAAPRAEGAHSQDSKGHIRSAAPRAEGLDVEAFVSALHAEAAKYGWHRIDTVKVRRILRRLAPTPDLIRQAIDEWYAEDHPGIDEDEWRDGLVGSILSRLSPQERRDKERTE